ncbi:MAG: hypothetical protein V2B20_13735 [Pseudomonadota bacterium]
MISAPQSSITTTELHPPATRSGGYCRRCKRAHFLGQGNTLGYCRQLAQLFAGRGTIDLFSGLPPIAPTLATEWLFGPARGKMFGVLECVRPDGTTTFLQAFSGQYNGCWLVNGWVPPLFDVPEFLALNVKGEPQIKALGKEIDRLKDRGDKWLALRKERRHLSRQLMKAFHDLYTLVNFRGETAKLSDVFLGKTGIPTGTGDCCAPKLLNFAACHQLRPIGLSEFYWGRENQSGTRRHGVFSSSCLEKCTPILGFMLCGLDTTMETGSELPKSGDTLISLEKLSKPLLAE